MKHWIKIILLLPVFLVVVFSTALAQTRFESNYAYYEGKVYAYQIEPPENWTLNIEDASQDGYTVAFYPDSESYLNSNMIIYVWVFKNDSLSFQQFISADSAYYLKKDAGLEFSETDTLVSSEGDSAIVLETTDPGGQSSIATIGYINARTEIIIYELNIKNRNAYREGQSKIREAFTEFTFVDKENK